MMLENMLGTKSKIRILRELSSNPDRDFSPEDLAKATEMSYGTIHPAMKELANCRAILVKKVGSSKIYRINQSHILFQELAQLLEREKTAFKDIAREFAEKIEKKGIENIILFGSVARGNITDVGDIDILIIYSGMYLTDKAHELEEEIMDKYDVVISPLYLSKKEVQSKIDDFDNFILNVIDEGKILHGDSEWLVK